MPGCPRSNVNSQNKRGTNAGQTFGEDRAMTELLQKVQGSNPPGGAAFSDCGMGYCGIFAKSIKCTIDTKIGNFSNGGELRFHGRAVTTVRPSRIQPPFGARGRRR